MTDLPDDESGDEADDETGRGGSWLTYRYRLGGAATPPAAGTIKAPSFMAAARRLMVERLGERLGDGPAYLRLRAAGEEEVLLEVARDPAGRASPVLTVVPGDRFRFEAEFGEPERS